MPEPLFDMRLRTLRHNRAVRRGATLFLHERAFEDCLERLRDIGRRFSSALLIAWPDQAWRARLRGVADEIEATSETESLARGRYDLCLAIGGLDTVNDLPGGLREIRRALKPGALFIGAMPGGDTLPQLRTAMRAADALTGNATPHVHPRIEASALAPLLSSAGFVAPVVDVDRVRVSYASLQRLVDDLRAMGATNILKSRSRTALGRAARVAAGNAFAALGDGQRTEELFEILHFAAWTPQQG